MRPPRKRRRSASSTAFPFPRLLRASSPGTRAVTRKNHSPGRREEFSRGRNLSADKFYARHGEGKEREKKKREDSSRTRGDRARGHEDAKGGREKRGREKKSRRRRGTYESHVVRSSRSSLAPAATAGTAPRTSGARFSRSAENTTRPSRRATRHELADGLRLYTEKGVSRSRRE